MPHLVEVAKHLKTPRTRLFYVSLSLLRLLYAHNRYLRQSWHWPFYMHMPFGFFLSFPLANSGIVAACIVCSCIFFFSNSVFKFLVFRHFVCISHSVTVPFNSNVLVDYYYVFFISSFSTSLFLHQQHCKIKYIKKAKCTCAVCNVHVIVVVVVVVCIELQTF